MNSWWEDYFGRSQEDESEEEDDKDEDDRDPRLAEELQRRLHPDIVSFLKIARQDYPGPTEFCHFFFYLEAIPPPREMIQALDNDTLLGFSFLFNSPQIDRCVWLYRQPNNPGGLVCVLFIGSSHICDMHFRLDQNTMEATNVFDARDYSVHPGLK
jgi:hypothetical protein